ncbi:hypothetical protein H632_c258p3 [Helicosporidium sp. ATCC 50920]|nr:hypothetical protein H632_c258p3 [Helicosporidium sp. ATCC 50920]|eukprot:KDD76351.1 hypothetical protein H632_c258p3 [Helicosporidium sp. ATCC 50920]
MEESPKMRKDTPAAVTWVLQNKLKAIFYTWGTGVGASLAYQWSRPIPTSLKVIHSRVYAQAITLAALGSVAALEMYTQASAPAEQPTMA